MNNEDKSFLGTGWAFPPEFDDISNTVKMVDYEEDIRQSLNIILSTNYGERVMNPEFGCGLKSMVFEVLNESIYTIMKDKIERAILFFEPRINLEKIEIDSKNYKSGVLNITLHYTIRKTNTRSNMVYPFYFREGTNI